MLRAILAVGLITASASAAVIVFAPYEPAADAQPATEAKPRLFPLGAGDTLAELRPAVPPAPLPARDRVAVSPAPVPPPPALPPVRNVTPEGMTRGPTVSGPLVRIPPPPAAATPKPVLAARSERLFNPMVTSAGVLKVRAREIQLAGIDAPPFEERCGEGAAAWPCGRMARAALRRFIRGRAIECAVPEGAETVPDVAECSVSGTKLSEWLVAQGWARQAHSEYAELEGKALQDKLGLWAEVRPDAPGSQAGLSPAPGGQPAELAARTLPSSPDSAAPMRARLSGTP